DQLPMAQVVAKARRVFAQDTAAAQATPVVRPGNGGVVDVITRAFSMSPAPAKLTPQAQPVPSPAVTQTTQVLPLPASEVKPVTYQNSTPYMPLPVLPDTRKVQVPEARPAVLPPPLPTALPPVVAPPSPVLLPPAPTPVVPKTAVAPTPVVPTTPPVSFR